MKQNPCEKACHRDFASSSIEDIYSNFYYLVMRVSFSGVF